MPTGCVFSRARRSTALRAARDLDRAALAAALQAYDVLASTDPLSPECFPIAGHDFLARAGVAMGMVRLDDLLGETEQVNLPGTALEHPNWRRKYRLSFEDLADDERTWDRLGHLPRLRAPGERSSL